MPKSKEDLLFETIKGILSVGGGLTGAGAGPLGAVGGAALGNSAGEEIHNLYRRNSGDQTQVPLSESLPTGAAQEMLGGIAGKAIGGLRGFVKPISSDPNKELLQNILSTLKKDVNGVPVVEYHGSKELIDNPKNVNRGYGAWGDSFFTTKDLPVAERFAQSRAMDSNGQPFISEFHLKDVPEITIDKEGAKKLGFILGLNDKEVAKAIKEAPNFGGGKESHDYSQLLYQTMLRDQIQDSNYDAYDDASALIKDAGIRRIIKSLGPRRTETINYFPEQDLVSKRYVQGLRDAVISNSIDTPVKTEMANKLIDLLGRTSSRANNGNK